MFKDRIELEMAIDNVKDEFAEREVKQPLGVVIMWVGAVAFIVNTISYFLW